MPVRVDESSSPFKEPSYEERIKGVPFMREYKPVPPPDICVHCRRPIYLVVPEEIIEGASVAWAHWDPTFDLWRERVMNDVALPTTWPRIHEFTDAGELKDITQERGVHVAEPMVVDWAADMGGHTGYQRSKPKSRGGAHAEGAA